MSIYHGCDALLFQPLRPCRSPAITVDGVTVTAMGRSTYGQSKHIIGLNNHSGGYNSQDFMIDNNAEGVYSISTEAGDYMLF